MMNAQYAPARCRGAHARSGRGPNSYGMQPPKEVFAALGLRPGDTVVDVGCGAGAYALHAAGMVGPTGHVFALDTRRESIDAVVAEAARQGLAHVQGDVCDVGERLPLEDGVADVVLLFTVLHIPDVRARADTMFGEFRRVLREGGRLAILECRKEDVDFGPPKAMRLDADDVEALARPWGFSSERCLTFAHTYLSCLKAV